MTWIVFVPFVVSGQHPHGECLDQGCQLFGLSLLGLCVALLIGMVVACWKL